MTTRQRTFTPAMKRILKLASMEAERYECFLGAEQVLIGMMQDGTTGAALMLKAAGFTIERLRKGEAFS